MPASARAKEGARRLGEYTAGSYVGGCILLVISNFSTAFGFFIWKSDSYYDQHLEWYQRWRWWCGFTCIFPLLVLFDCLSYAMLPQSVISCFGGLSIVFTVLLAQAASMNLFGMFGFANKIQQNLTRVEWLSILCVLAGSSLISIYDGVVNADDQHTTTMQEAADAVVRGGTIGYCIMAWVVGFLCSWFICRGGMERFEGTGWVPYICVGTAFAAGTCSAVSVATMSVISTAIYAVADEGWDVVTDWPGTSVWYATMGIAISVPLQYVTLHATIKFSPLGLGVPAYQSFVAIMGLSASYVIWAPPSSAGTITVSIISTAMVIVGLAMLCYRQSIREHEEELAEAEEKKDAEGGASAPACEGGPNEATPLVPPGSEVIDYTSGEYEGAVIKDL